MIGWKVLDGRMADYSGRMHRLIGPAPPPLRDLLRGAKTAAEVTEESLAPASNLLPGTLAALFRATLETLEASGRALVANPPSAEDIRAASRYLAGIETGLRTIDNFVSVFGSGWDRCVANERPRQRLQFSETIAGLKVAALAGEMGEGRSREFRAARIIVAMRKVHATARVPGTPIMLTAEQRFRANLAMFAVALWLLADRPERHSEEDRILDLSYALTNSQGSGELFSELNDVEAIGFELARLRPHV